VAKPTFVIVGASLAGAKAAEALRDEGFDGRVVLVGEESERPYERPPLSKEYLRGEAGREKVYVHEDAFYEDREIELRLSARATKIDVDSGKVVLGNGESIAYDRLMLATGAAPRKLALPGEDLEGVYYLRSVHDSDVIRNRFKEGVRVVIVGAGWIGSEVAASARQKGAEVTMLERSSVPLERVLGAEVGAIYRDIHLEKGVDIRPGTRVAAFEGNNSVQRVRTEEGDSIECDFVVVGVGVSPRTELAEAAGLELDNGVAANEFLETSVPGIFAGGDVANAWHPFYEQRIRVEHWDNAINQGTAAGKNMLGAQAAYDHIPYFFSDQYDVGMEYSGFAANWDRVAFRGDPDGREFIAFWLESERVIAAMNVNVWDVSDPLRAIISSRRPVDANRLTDPDVPLDEIAPPTDQAG
jgi:3-phenylpropionate/trans-cinnamate dioxygenase ferredoxin reductase subunit